MVKSITEKNSWIVYGTWNWSEFGPSPLLLNEEVNTVCEMGEEEIDSEGMNEDSL